MQSQSQSIGKLAAALAKAQAKIRGAVKDSQNPFFKSSYADLESVWSACREPLTSNGLAILQTLQTDQYGTKLVTTLAHESGEYVSGAMPLLLKQNDMQSLGAAVTYARRYSLSAIVNNVTGELDDDGETAVGRGASRPAPVVSRSNTNVSPADTIAQKIAAPVAAAQPKAERAADSGALGTVVKMAHPETQQLIASTIDSALSKGTGKLGAPFDLVLAKGPHAGKQIQALSKDEAKSYFAEISGELKAINRSPATLRGPSRDVYYALEQYINLT